MKDLTNLELYRKSKDNQHSTTTITSHLAEYMSAGIVLIHLSSRPPSQLNQTVDELFYNTEYHISKGNLPDVPIVSYIRCRSKNSAVKRIQELTQQYSHLSITTLSYSPIDIQVENVSAVSLQELENAKPNYQLERSDAEIERRSFRNKLRSRCPIQPKPTSTQYLIPLPIQLKKELKQLSGKQVEELNAGLLKMIRESIDNSWNIGGSGS